MKYQRGVSLLSLVLIIGVIAFFVTLAMRILPMYQEYSSVQTVMDGMKTEIENNKLTKNQVNLLLKKRFNTSYIESVKDENIQIFRGKNNPFVTKIVIDYEVRAPFIREIGLVGHFVSIVDVEENNKK